MLRFALGALAIGAPGAFGFVTLNYFYVVMTQVALLLVPIVGLFVAAEILLLVWLGKHGNPRVAAAGKVIGNVLVYTLLFQGIFFTTVVLWAVSIGFGFGPDGPQSRAAFLGDFLIGAGYLSAFILGATGLTALMTEGILRKLLAALYATVTIGLPVALLIFAEAEMRAIALSRPGVFALSVVTYLMAASVAGMALLLPDGPGPTKGGKKGGAKTGRTKMGADPAGKLAGPRGRLPD